MIKVFGNPASTCTRKVLTALAETGTPFEMTVVDLSKGEHKEAPHTARQPFGQVPTIDDDGFKLYESRAICRYLSDKAGGKLAPKDARQRALMDQWLSVEQSNFSPAAMKLIFEHVFKRPQDPAALEAAMAMIDKVYDVIEKPLSQMPYLAGEELSLADIGYMPYVEYLQATPGHAVLEKHPQVAGWWRRVSERPSWRKATGRG